MTMVFTNGLRDAVLPGVIPGASFCIMSIVIIQSNPETINQIRFMLNKGINNTMLSTEKRPVLSICSNKRSSEWICGYNNIPFCHSKKPKKGKVYQICYTFPFSTFKIPVGFFDTIFT